MNEKPKDLREAKAELESTMTAHQTAARALGDAQRDETSARNRLNNAQKAFDAAVEAIRKDAPRDSDWHSARQRSAAR